MSYVPYFNKGWDETRKHTRTVRKIHSDTSESKVVLPEVRQEKTKNQKNH